MMVNATYVHVHACVILGMWRPAGRKTRVDTLRNDNCGSGEAIGNFSNEASDVNGFQQESGALACGGAQETSHVLLHVRANRDSPVSWR